MKFELGLLLNTNSRRKEGEKEEEECSVCVGQAQSVRRPST